MGNWSKYLPASFKRQVKRWLYWGQSRYCSICESHLRYFAPHGEPKRANAFCPVCWSVERHRLAWLFLQEKTSLFDTVAKRFLHVAPTQAMEASFRRFPNIEQVTVDLESPLASLHYDLHMMPHPDNCFDVIYCSHVLEHVEDDGMVLREFRRVLKPQGWALLLVPISGEQTLEDHTVIDPLERKRLFGQEDHVRSYGRDFESRLKEQGFCVKAFDASVVLGKEKWEELGIKDEPLFYCTLA